jgi:hypothetical protein
VENVGVGISVLEKLLDLEYSNIYFSVKSTHEFVEQYQAESMTNSVPGFTTSTKTRPIIVAKLEEFIRNKLITIYSQRTFKEITTFIWYNGKPQAMRGYNDDLILALAIGCWVRDTALQANKRDVEYKKALIDSIFVTNTKLNTTIKGMRGYKSNDDLDRFDKAKQEHQEYKWLYKG